MGSHILLEGGAVYVGAGAEVIENGFVEIDGDRIGRVGRVSDLTSDFEAMVVDTTGGTVLPGIIDTHMHVFHEPQMLKLPEGAAAVWGANYLQSALRAGVTTVRDLGAKSPAVFGLKRALDAGYAVGPRYLISGQAICMTGGHGWANLSVEADGPDAVRQEARRQLKAGADVIKLMATGGAGTLSELPTSVQLSEDEMRAAVTEAHNAGKTVAVHALAAKGIVNAIRAGADTVEHGVFLDDEGIELFLTTGAVLCPTISVYPRIVERGARGGEAQFVIDRSVALIGPHFRNFSKAVKAGVKIVFGTDATTLYNPVGDFATEMDLMVQAGMSPIEVLQSATSTAARICRLEDSVGTLAQSKRADVLVVAGDATKDIAAVGNTKTVYLAGEIVYAIGEGYRNANLTARPVLSGDFEL